jgi:hypothetical protein
VCSFPGVQIDETVQQAGVHTMVVSEVFSNQTMGYAIDYA